MINIIISTVLFIILIAKIAPYKTDRYIYHLYPLIFIIIIYIYILIINKKTIKYFLLVFLVSNIIGYYQSGIKWLYIGTENQIDILKKHKNNIAILITHNNRRFVSAVNCWHLTYSDYIYPTNKKGIPTIKNAITHKNYKNIILYLDKNIPDDFRVILLQVVNNIGDIEYSKHIFSNQVSRVFLLRRK